jgi:hypothetical protein
VAAVKRGAQLEAQERHTIESLTYAWYERYIVRSYKHPKVVVRVLCRHIIPVIGKVAIREERASHIDKVLVQTVRKGAPTVANDALRYLTRMIHFALKKHWVAVNPAAGVELSDAAARKRLAIAG